MASKQVQNEMRNAYGNEAPCESTIYKWYSFFVRGGESTADGDRSGRPQLPVNPRLIDGIRKLIEEDPKISLSLLSTILGETKNYVRNIIKEYLDIQFQIARWVPTILDQSKKSERVKCCKQVIKEFGDDWDQLTANMMTVDETWIYFEPRGNRKSGGEWRVSGEKPPEVGRIKTTSKKVMLTVFWNSRGIVHLDYLKTGKSINKEYYDELLKTVNSKIRARDRKKVIFLQDNAPAHKAKDTIDLIKSFGWNLIKHPPYSPDLSPSDY